MLINILCIGDVVGKAGRNVIAESLGKLISEHNIDLVVCNAENAAGGSGITPQIFDKIKRYGVDVVTLGDHCFRKSDIYPILDTSDCIIRPVNLPSSSAGRGWTVVPTKSGCCQVGVVAVLGQLNMNNADSPWQAIDETFQKMPSDVNIRIVDFHGETTSEKIAMGWHCNGRASIVFGTHTHVPTADACVLDGGTAFISDVGMTGPYDSILGRRKDRVLKYLTSAMPQKFDVAVGDPRMYCLKVAVETTSGKAVSAAQLVIYGKVMTGGNVDSDDFNKNSPRANRK